MDDRLSFRNGEIKRFIEQVQIRLRVDAEGIGKLVGLSARTIRDWKREKYRPAREAILKLSKISNLELSEYQVISWMEHIKRAAHLGGKRRYELYGPIGTIEDRSKGGKASWNKRKDNPELWVKYTNSIIEPEESRDLAEFIGIMLGDGGLTHFQCSVYLNSEIDREFSYYVRDLVLRLFGITPKIYIHKKHKVLSLVHN